MCFKGGWLSRFVAGSLRYHFNILGHKATVQSLNGHNTNSCVDAFLPSSIPHSRLHVYNGVVIYSTVFDLSSDARS